MRELNHSSRDPMVIALLRQKFEEARANLAGAEASFAQLKACAAEAARLGPPTGVTAATYLAEVEARLVELRAEADEYEAMFNRAEHPGHA